MSASNPTTSGLYNFMSGAPGQNQQANAGINQYLAQGQSGISPGQVQTAASNPLTLAAQKGIGSALSMVQANGMPQQPQQQPMPAVQNTLAAGANMQPNVGGQNMGGVGPTVNNAAALTYQQQLANALGSDAGS